MKRWSDDMKLGLLLALMIAAAVFVHGALNPGATEAVVGAPQTTEVRFLFPPVCVEEATARVCVAWDPYLHTFTEVKRIPKVRLGPSAASD